MAVEGLGVFLEGKTGKNTRSLLRLVILLTIAAAAVSSRLFSVISEYTQAPEDR
jgi:dolichyl-diphosphooligosaccharide---protein glycosyltransferase